jgi:hypothetical protein
MAGIPTVRPPNVLNGSDDIYYPSDNIFIVKMNLS